MQYNITYNITYNNIITTTRCFSTFFSQTGYGGCEQAGTGETSRSNKRSSDFPRDGSYSKREKAPFNPGCRSPEVPAAPATPPAGLPPPPRRPKAERRSPELPARFEVHLSAVISGHSCNYTLMRGAVNCARRPARPAGPGRLRRGAKGGKGASLLHRRFFS